MMYYSEYIYATQSKGNNYHASGLLSIITAVVSIALIIMLGIHYHYDVLKTLIIMSNISSLYNN